MSTVDPTAEDNDQYPDFRLLLSGNSKGQQALPTKEAKASQGSTAAVGDAAATLLNEQYDAYFQILKEERRAAERTYSRAVYEPERGLFRLTANRGTHFVSMGHTIKGQIYLYPEEALYLMDRGSLLIDYQGAPITLQQMWSVYLSPPFFHPNSEIGNCIESGSDLTQPSNATKSMERYLIYSYLKRLGFVVTRPGTYDVDPSLNAKSKKSKESTLSADQPISTTATKDTTLPVDKLTNMDLKQSQEQGVVSLRNPFWTLLADSWSHLTVGIKRWWHIKRFIWSGKANRPIIAQTDRIPIGQILSKLQVIPDLRLASKAKVSSSKSTNQAIDFLVYKPAGAFKKRQPGNPDYRVIVIRGDSSLPSLLDLRDLLQGQDDPVLETNKEDDTLAKGTKQKPKKENMDAWPRVLFAVVNGGQVSFVNSYNIKATP
ncbi:tRNA-splicing endonuclease subunit Sen54 [Entomortierella parvispora]|uniref:tRNA-splicing endonuclease subunit Sen54 n=1 Tax=Entomortierella parvispora TaxID=205924 RepID=A0A9P3HBD2_9FUNG|nr:tRNA-splicing endonuclease subunit Sen54 [Entomortierella parvispora]